MHGTTPADRLDRQHLLAVNLEAVRRAMAEASCNDPVGFVIDATDHGGRLFTTHVLAQEQDISVEEAEVILDRRAEEYRARGEFPTFVLAADWSFAEAVLPLLSHRATENLALIRRDRQPGQYLVVAVGSGGNSYSLIQVNRPAADGQHRVRIDFPGS